MSDVIDFDINDMNGDDFELARERFDEARRTVALFDLDLGQAPPPHPSALPGMVNRQWMRSEGPSPWRGIERATGEQAKVAGPRRRLPHAALIEPIWYLRS